MDTDTLTEALLEQAEAIIRVSPSQRSPPRANPLCRNVLSNERGDALSDDYAHAVTRTGHNCPITV
jgi:hypothetical protein